MGTYVKKTAEQRMSSKATREVQFNELQEQISEEYLDYTLPELLDELRGIVEEDVTEYKIRIKILKEKIRDARIDFEEDN